MATGAVVVTEVVLQPSTGFVQVGIGVEIDLLVLETSPEAFDEHIVDPATFTIHADPDAVALEHAGERLSGELCTLVGIENLRCAVAG